MKSRSRVYHTLDALRGLAAICVVMIHGQKFFEPVSTKGGGYLAVDLFFMMSGFVIARAYDERFNAGMGTLEFMRIRLIRLFPLYLFGTVLGILAVTASFLGRNSDHWSPFTLSLMTAFSAIALPNFTHYQSGQLFPFNIPCWSLWLEIVINLAYAMLWRHLTSVRLTIILAVSVCCLATFIWINGTIDGGYTRASLLPGIVRTIFGFSLGVLLSRIPTPQEPRSNALGFVAICLTFVFVIYTSPTYMLIRDSFAVMLVFPLIVYAATLVEPPKWLHSVATFFGVTSYAIYLIHEPVLRVLSSIFRSRMDSIGHPLYVGLPMLAILLSVCWLVDRYYDLPVRRGLSRWHARRQVAKEALKQ